MKWSRGLVFKLAVSFALISFLIVRYGRDPAFRAVLAGLDPWALAGAGGVVLVGLALSGIRWKVLLAAAGVQLPFVRALQLYLVGYFFNFFLPTTVGGDVARGMGAAAWGPLSVVGASILVERLLGFACLLILGLTGSMRVENLAVARGVLLTASAAFLSGVAILLFAPLPEPRGEGRVARALAGLRRTALTVRGYGFHPGALGLGFLLSFGWQGGLVISNAWLSHGLGGVAPTGDLVALVPVVQAITMIPISFGGLGVREMGYEYFFRVSGHDPAGAVALGAAWLALTIIVAVLGGIVYLVSPFGRARTGEG
ncbi:MAG: flippase-like domain-containing protein [Gemmatimonadetes bacterium]|nr:flippase-like domain-containing protein [Gemmatimonadota bacterium]